ncbi:winged helix DNA-binding domain-containing protein [Agromyces silvae]|uniref:winged helix DNA-binding domain-containing protein n=1 Tax=Agromyces silvae TaxID=3388266 RepID=UPI00280A57C6|nr:winged helix DNA-binding domain-containing protein [Agromyces protaetiae]
MDAAELRSRRLLAQRLRGPVATTPAELVRRAVAVQSQEYLPAQWGLAQRIPAAQRPDAAAVAAAIDDGQILRTHVLRPTWHFVAPEDARWLLELSAERVHRVNRTYYRRTGIEEVLVAGSDAIARATADGPCTRAELAAALDAAGLPLTGTALALLIMYAELERVVISGPSAGKQRTYAAFDERVPAAPARHRDEALADLAERYLVSRGPASARDFAAWSGFTLGDARTALASAAERTAGRVEALDDELWHDASVSALWHEASDIEPCDAGDPERVDLLQAYDEYIMGYAAPRAYLQPPGRGTPVIPEFPLHAMMAGGVMAGRWAPTVRPASASVRIVPWRRMSRTELRSRDAVVAEVEAFLGVPVTVDVEPVSRV